MSDCACCGSDTSLVTGVLSPVDYQAFAQRYGERMFGSNFALTTFPCDQSSSDGLLGYTAELNAALAFSAYVQGVFPWYNEARGEPVLWWSMDPRFVISRESFHVPKRIERLLKKAPFTYTMDTDFDAVVAHCACMNRAGQDGTWLGPALQEVYHTFHARGIAHSVELWQNGTLVGGLFGELLGHIFCGESMFTLLPNSSKTAFVIFARAFFACGGELIDAQIYTDNIARYGAFSMQRDEFLAHERAGIPRPLGADLRQAFTEVAQSYGKTCV